MSEEVKRYNFSVDNSGSVRGYESEHGGWVKWTDYDALLAERDALRKDAERWRKAREILPVEAIKIAHSDFVNFGLPPDEKENVRVDDAIDAAMAKATGE